MKVRTLPAVFFAAALVITFAASLHAQNLEYTKAAYTKLAPGPFAVAPAGSSQSDGATPQGFQTYRDPQGTGILLYQPVEGGARSATAVLLSVLANPRGYFDRTPELHTVVRDDDDRRVQAMFSATVQKAPVLGVAGVDLGASGGSVSLLYDRPESFRYSFPRLRQVLAANTAQGGAEVQLQPMTLGDGSTISLPPGWRVTFAGKGSVDLQGPRGEGISLGAAAPVYSRVQRLPGMPANYLLQAPCCDPVRAYVALFPQISAGLQKMGLPPQQLTRIVEAQATPWPGGQAAYILSEYNRGGHRTLAYGLLVAMSSGFDPWTLYTSSVAAPEEVFRAEFAVMLRVWKSYSVNPAVFRERLDNAVKSMNECWKMIRQVEAERTRASLSAAEGWDQYVRGVQTIEHTGSGTRFEAPNTDSQRLVDWLSRQGDGHWRIVPPSELIPRR